MQGEVLLDRNIWDVDPKTKLIVNTKSLEPGSAAAAQKTHTIIAYCL
jgi:hypothetical protein